MKLKLAALVFVSVAQTTSIVSAEGIHFPTISGISAQESISTQDGTICTQNVDGRASLKVGLYGDSESSNNNSFYQSRQNGGEFGGFVMVNIPLSAPHRLDCAKLLEIEYERAKLRLKREQMDAADPSEQGTQNPLYK